MKAQKKGVLFVCHGNICRSPAAEGVFQALIQVREVSGAVFADSAGTSDEHAGELAHAVTRRIASKHGINLTHKSRVFEREDFDLFHLILLMDNWNFRNVSAMARNDADLSKLRMYRSFDPASAELNRIPEVPDPYYGGIEGFEQVHGIFERTSPHILTYLLESK
ncbi:MAG: low molecular weight phosphotyrosine protein phosphatase [Spirochaetia bacterium]|nr:low molecular weight phosphotyrosine protein phosphatase [Spirochaetia bacterium]